MKLKNTLRQGNRMFILVIFSNLFFPIYSCSQASQDNVLIGEKQFVITTMEKGKPETGVIEQLVFKDSIFDNLQCHQYGFTSTTYTATKDGDNISFIAEMPGFSEGIMTWTGLIIGDSIQGTMVWKKDGQADMYYTFVGYLGLLPEKKEVSLDGKIYLTNTMELGKPETAYDEDWTFEAGTLRSPSCEPYGFSKSPYKAWEHDGKITMECKFESLENGHMNFTATIIGNNLTGEVVWIKSGQNDMQYAVTGVLKE
jgi:hypothetical protein